MADQIPLPTKDEEVSQEIKDYQELHNSSYRELISKEQKAEEKPEEPEKPAVEEPAKPTEDEEKQKLETEQKLQAEEAEKARLERDEQLAKKAADEVLARQREEADKRVADEAKAKEHEELKTQSKPKWEWDNDPNRPKDANGKPLPYSYAELTEENRRLGKLDAIQEWEQREAARAAEAEATRKAEEEKQAIAQKQQDEFNAQLKKEMDADLNDLYLTNKLPKIVNKDDPNDPGILARNKLFTTGMQVNKERKAKGLDPIRSIKLVYYEHYNYKEASSTVPGHDAPVMGNAAPPAQSVNDDEYDWAKDHKKTPRQLMSEVRKKVLGQAN